MKTLFIFLLLLSTHAFGQLHHNYRFDLHVYQRNIISNNSGGALGLSLSGSLMSILIKKKSHLFIGDNSKVNFGAGLLELKPCEHVSAEFSFVALYEFIPKKLSIGAKFSLFEVDVFYASPTVALYVESLLPNLSLIVFDKHNLNFGSTRFKGSIYPSLNVEYNYFFPSTRRLKYLGAEYRQQFEGYDWFSDKAEIIGFKVGFRLKIDSNKSPKT
jgi:hypothetical protein